MTILEFPFPHVNLVVIAIGPVRIHWYAIMHSLAFAMAYGLMRLRLRHQPFASATKPSIWVPADIEDLLLYGTAGVILEGRLGYVLFCQLDYCMTHPLDVLKVWGGRMSFHGGAIGVILGMAFFTWWQSRPSLQVANFLVPSVLIGPTAGQIGNFINGELWDRATPPDLPWAMRFPIGGSVLRHSSQLYQTLLERVLLLVLSWFYAHEPRLRGQVAAAFLASYNLFRFITKYWREPGFRLRFLPLGLSVGQWLLMLVIFADVALWLWARKRGISDVQEPTDDPGEETIGENPEESAGDDIERKSTGVVEEFPEIVDEAGETPVEKDETLNQS